MVRMNDPSRRDLLAAGTSATALGMFGWPLSASAGGGAPKVPKPESIATPERKMRARSDRAKQVVTSVADFGTVGIGGNDTSVFAAALASLGNRAALYIPAGLYILDSNALSLTLSPGQSLRLYGDGAHTTVLGFPHNGNGLSLTYTGNQFAWLGGNNVIIEDLAFVTNVQNTGSAVTLNGASAIGDPNRPTILNRLGFSGTGANSSYWASGIAANDLQNLSVNDCYYFSNVLGLAGTGIAYTGSTNGTHPTVLNVRGFNMQFGGTGIQGIGYIEGLNVAQSNFAQVNYGVVWRTATALPQCSISHSQINAKSGCIVLSNATAGQITGNLMFMAANAPNGAPAIVGNPTLSTITGNTLVSLGTTSNGIILQGGASDNVIVGNVFKSFDTNIWFQKGANRNVIGLNRSSGGRPYYDQGSGNTHRSLAFEMRVRVPDAGR